MDMDRNAKAFTFGRKIGRYIGRTIRIIVFLICLKLAGGTILPNKNSSNSKNKSTTTSKVVKNQQPYKNKLNDKE